MATMSALIAGFTYGGLTVNIPQEVSTFLTLGYLSTTTLSMCFALLTIIISTFVRLNVTTQCNMFGPGLALRGGEGYDSVHKAIEHLKGESKKSFKFFMISLSFFHISSFLLMWLLYDWLTSLIINVVLLVFLVMFLQNGFAIVDELFIPEASAVTSKFEDFGGEQNPTTPPPHAPTPEYYRHDRIYSSGSEAARSRGEVSRIT